jgi:hypothetical protein
MIENSCTLVDVNTLSNHVNLCLNFSYSISFQFILVIIVVHSNDNNVTLIAYKIRHSLYKESTIIFYPTPIQLGCPWISIYQKKTCYLEFFHLSSHLPFLKINHLIYKIHIITHVSLIDLVDFQ